uniref:Uncharacterized protein n=1 Tax=Nomascus leucogenys TaxID=61853 RepID=A0A2I3G938_NOMLE
VTWQLQKAEPPHDFSEAENLSSPLTALEFMARSKSTAFSPTYVLLLG